ncbi:MAG: hypothetical protein K2G22_06380 [Eubacterium sp.]|nr:hypothetical protein [Eubacterium sp.]MDE7124473.1 hypothetical protein [Eubacterium sp.]
MNIKNLINYFYYWLKDKSSEEITHSRKYAKYEIERLLAEQSEAELLLRKENILICKCRYNYVIHKIHSSDNAPHLFEFEAIGYAEAEGSKYTYFEYIITHR